MSDSSPNPSQQVERLREILVGPGILEVESRLRNIEHAIVTAADGEAPRPAEDANAGLVKEIHNLRLELQNESELRGNQIAQLTEQLNAATRRLEEASAELRRQDRHVEEHLSQQLEYISSAMAARIDARVREILQHLQNEVSQWKHQIDRDIYAVRETKADRHEVRNKFARLAAAAMEDGPRPDSSAEDKGYLL